MAADTAHQGANKDASHSATEMDYPAHERNYGGFITLLKWTIVVTGIITAVVVYIIAN